MAIAKVHLKLTGGLASRNQIEGYDGFNALANSAFALSLIANYVETGVVRRKGDFKLRHSVHAEPISPGSVATDISVPLSDTINPKHKTTGSPVALFLGLARRIVGGNIGIELPVLNAETQSVITQKGGDVEALVSAAEPSMRRAHDAIGGSATNFEWTSGFSSIGNFDAVSKAYMNDTVPDKTRREKDVSVSGFLGNSGRGLVFDRQLHRNVSVIMRRDTLNAIGRVFSYGLDEYMNHTGNLIRIEYTRMNATDGRVKRFVIEDARVTQMAGTIID